MKVSPPIEITEAFFAYKNGAELVVRVNDHPTRVRVMELHLTAQNGRVAFIVEVGAGTGWFRVDLDAGPSQVAEPVKPGE